MEPTALQLADACLSRLQVDGEHDISSEELQSIKNRLLSSIRIINGTFNSRSAINRLHPEILYHIFQYVPAIRVRLSVSVWTCDSIMATDELIPLTQVCHRWREIALAHSLLWTGISDDSNAASIFLKRSGNSPLKLYLKRPDSRFSDELLAQHGPRVRELFVKPSPTSSWRSANISSILDFPAPELEDLSISFDRIFVSSSRGPAPDVAFPTIFCGVTPKLRFLALHYVQWLPINQFASLTPLSGLQASERRNKSVAYPRSPSSLPCTTGPGAQRSVVRLVNWSTSRIRLLSHAVPSAQPDAREDGSGTNGLASVTNHHLSGDGYHTLQSGPKKSVEAGPSPSSSYGSRGHTDEGSYNVESGHALFGRRRVVFWRTHRVFAHLLVVAAHRAYSRYYRALGHNDTPINSGILRTLLEVYPSLKTLVLFPNPNDREPFNVLHGRSTSSDDGVNTLRVLCPNLTTLHLCLGACPLSRNLDVILTNRANYGHPVQRLIVEYEPDSGLQQPSWIRTISGVEEVEFRAVERFPEMEVPETCKRKVHCHWPGRW
ncbi:hypothetical protein A0H81_00281 [Grifola frondosa]|uniref:Uncharacterized protein n=1 Tax=Grifola frondosa TaxID=5627 RepID=A0A1C7MRR0_GRIFR|nr:hypothetical protein A0H81_00281 [Grifola frondosa]